MAAAAARLALVTGGNRGIGLEVVRGLARRPGFRVLLGSRCPETGAEALRGLGSPSNVSVVPVDVLDAGSIAAAAAAVRDEHGGRLDVLVNNAGYLSPGDETSGDIAKRTVGTNFFGVVDTTREMVKLMGGSADPRVVTVGATMGMAFARKLPEPLKSRLTAEDLTLERLEELALEYVEGVYAGRGEGETGWPDAMHYAASKALAMRTHLVFPAAFAGGGESPWFASVCPGVCDTDMMRSASPTRAKRTAADGADTVVFAATEAEGRSGQFWANRRARPTR